MPSGAVVEKGDLPHHLTAFNRQRCITRLSNQLPFLNNVEMSSYFSKTNHLLAVGELLRRSDRAKPLSERLGQGFDKH